MTAVMLFAAAMLVIGRLALCWAASARRDDGGAT